MKETIYLVCDRQGVRRMTKNLPSTSRFEIPVRIKIEVEENAFRTPVIEKEVFIDDWREGIDIADVNFTGTAITEEEAKLIRDQRIAKMTDILEERGYKITAPEKE